MLLVNDSLRILGAADLQSSKYNHSRKCVAMPRNIFMLLISSCCPHLLCWYPSSTTPVKVDPPRRNLQEGGAWNLTEKGVYHTSVNKQSKSIFM